MKKLLGILLVGAVVSSFACNIDLAKNPIKCGGKTLTDKSTYGDFSGCKVEEVKKKHFKNGYKVELSDDANKDYECFFADTKVNTVVKNCKMDD